MHGDWRNGSALILGFCCSFFWDVGCEHAFLEVLEKEGTKARIEIQGKEEIP